MTRKSKIITGGMFGEWELIEQIGRGGNGVVWKAKNSKAQFGAIKFLHGRYNRDCQRYERFKVEAQAMQDCADIPGVLQLLDVYIPDSPDSNSKAWLVSAYATPLSEYLKRTESIEDCVSLCASLANTASLMHERGYSHRDIKPENIFLHNGNWCFGDFGIVDFPDKEALTQAGEKLGPMYYIAPEMLNDAEQADGRSADVYSLAKLLWKLASGQRFPLPGVQSADEPAMTISAYVASFRAHLLDRLIEASTQVDPHKRPLMDDFHSELIQWLRPPVKAESAKDLLDLSDRITGLVHLYGKKQRQHSVIQAKADEERKRVFKAFEPTLHNIHSALNDAGLSALILPASGGNASYYRLVTSKPSAGADDRTWFFQYSVITDLRGDLQHVRLMIGVNLGIKNVENETGVLHDIYVPVLAAAGFILKLIQPLPNGESERLLWGDSGSFLFGHPSESELIARLNAGLHKNMKVAVKQMLDTFEAGEFLE